MQTRTRRLSLLPVVFFIAMLVLVSCGRATPTPMPEPTPSAQTILGQAQVESVDILMLESFPVQVRALVQGILRDDCTTIQQISTERIGNQFVVTITTERPADVFCVEVVAPFEENIAIEAVGLPAGVYTVTVNGVSARFELTVDNVLQEPGELPTPAIVAETPAGAAPDAAVVAAQIAIAQQFGLPANTVEVVEVEPVEWPDGCLGLPQAGEFCIQQIVPGYLIVLRVGDASYAVRTDESGEVVRVDTGVVPATSAEPAPDCTNLAAFVRDVTVRDNSRIEPGATFLKTWRLRNDGTCTWSTGYALIFDSGDQMGGPDVVPLPREVRPGDTVDVSATLSAPLQRGTYQGFWKLRSAHGQVFALGRDAGRPFWVLINVPRTITPTPDPGGSTINGRVWHDLCASGRHGEPAPAQPPPGCIRAADGSYVADGIRQEGEPPIAGMEVQLGAGPCPAVGLLLTLADAQGLYRFATLEAGTYCVSIDPLSEHNLPIFIPGDWTFPPGGAHTVTVDGSTDVSGVDFGWDYQFAP